MTTRILIPTGAIGLGFDEAALWRGIDSGIDAICVDGGSTDSGPHYLGTGTSKYSRAATKSEWRTLMRARAQAGVPLIIGTAGTCGTDATVDWMADITRELAGELGQDINIARVYASQDKARVVRSLDRISPLWPELPLDATTLEACTNIVALAGAEQIAAAIATGRRKHRHRWRSPGRRPPPRQRHRRRPCGEGPRRHQPWHDGAGACGEEGGRGLIGRELSGWARVSSSRPAGAEV